MRIVILAYTHNYLRPIMAYQDRHIEKIKAIAPDTTIIVVDPADGQDAVDQAVKTADVLVLSPLDHTNLVDLDQAPALKWLHLTAAGTGVFVDRLQDRPVLLSNSSGVHPIPIAEHVLSYMLMFSRRFTVTYRSQITSKSWDQDGIVSGLTELHGATLGIVGFGRIGRRIAGLAKAFDMRVVALSHSDPDIQNPLVDRFYSPGQMPELLAESDFVVNCLPLTKDTEGTFDSKAFQSMKPSAYFVNIGRGQTVDEPALVEALQSGSIAGAGLDVFAAEPLADDSPLWSLDNVIITPHIAGWTPKYIDRMTDIFCSNLQAYIAGTDLPTIVDKQKSY